MPPARPVRLRPSSILALSGVFLAAAMERAEAPAFRPDLDQEWERLLVERTSWVLDDVRMALNGEELGFDFPTVEARLERRAVLADRVAALADGRVTRLARRFPTLAGRFELDLKAGGESVAYGFDLESPLADEEVLFDASEDGAYRASWARENGPDASLLEGLAFAADAQMLLPTDEVEEGDAWELAGPDLVALLTLGGDLAFVPAEAPGGSVDMVPSGGLVGGSLLALGELRGGSFEGEAEVRFRGVETRDERRLALLELTFEGSVTTDRSKAFQRAARAIDLPAGAYAFTFEAYVEGEGTLLWDLEAGLAESLVLTSEVAFEAEGEWPEGDGSDVRLDFSGTFEASGDSELRLTRE